MNDDDFLKEGTYRPDGMVFAFTAGQLVFESESRDAFDLNRALAQYRNPALVVYRASNFRGCSETYQ